MEKLDIKIYGIEERQDNIFKNKMLLNLSDCDIFISEQSTRTKIEDKWPYSACKKAFTQPIPAGVTHRLVLQDDVELCNDFLYYANKIINAHPDAIFFLTSVDTKEGNFYKKNSISPYRRLAPYITGCSILIPVKYIDDLFESLDKEYPQIKIGRPHEDAAIITYARRHKIPLLTTVPALTQHLGKSSSLCCTVTYAKAYYFSGHETYDWDSKVVGDYDINMEEWEKHREEIKQPCDDNEIHYFVRTTGEREFNYYPLKTINLYDYEHKPVDSFIQQLLLISRFNAVLLEDDLVLCKNFQEEIEKAIKQYPNNIIQFFTLPASYVTTHMKSWPFQWNQCTYYPKGIAGIVAEEMKRVRNCFPPDQLLYSQVESMALLNLKIPFIVYRPCLVQHNDFSSILQPTPTARRDTLWFLDYINELGVSYEEAYTPENVMMLQKIREEHVKKLTEESMQK